MKSIKIITDSHSSISQQTARELGITVLPMPFYIDGTCFYEDVTLSREDFFAKLSAGADVSTSQLAPTEVLKAWDEALLDHDQVLYIPISSGLSGSCMTALAMAQEEPYAGRVFVVDNGRVSALLHRSILDALELIEEGYDARAIKDILENARDKMTIYIAVDTLTHLKKGGRISSATALIGSVLNIKPILKLDVGTLDMYKKCRGFVMAKKAMIAALKQDLQTTFQEWYDRGEVYLMAASSASAEATREWIAEIRNAFPGMDVLYDDLSLGVSCHIGPGGLGIGCSCRPHREQAAAKS